MTFNKAEGFLRTICPDCGREISVGTDKFNRTERDLNGYRIYPHHNLELKRRCTASRMIVSNHVVYQAKGGAAAVTS